MLRCYLVEQAIEYGVLALVQPPSLLNSFLCLLVTTLLIGLMAVSEHVPSGWPLVAVAIVFSFVGMETTGLSTKQNTAPYSRRGGGTMVGESGCQFFSLRLLRSFARRISGIIDAIGPMTRHSIYFSVTSVGG